MPDSHSLQNAVPQPLNRSPRESDGNPPSFTSRTMAPVLGAVAALGFILGVLFFVHFRDFYSNDSYSYVTAASNLAAGNGFVNALGEPETIRTPGYPALIGAFLRMHLGLQYLIIFQHLLRILLAVATAAFAFRLTQSRRLALLAGIVLCLDLPTLDVANSILTETAFTVVLAVALGLLWKASAGNPKTTWGWLVAAGLLAGTSVLVRPVSMFFFVPAVLYLLLARKRRGPRAACIFVLAFACLPLAWAIRNYHRTGSLVISPISAWNMLAYRAAGVLAIDDPGDFTANLEERQRQLLRQVCDEMKALAEPDCIPLITTQRFIPQKAEYFMRVGRGVVLRHPLGYVKLALRGAALIMLGGDAVRLAQIIGISRSFAERVLLLYTFPMFCLLLLGAWRFWRDERTFFFLASLLIIYFVAISAGAEAYSRFRVPVMPVCAILVAAGADTAARRFFGAVRALRGNVKRDRRERLGSLVNHAQGLRQQPVGRIRAYVSLLRAHRVDL